MNLAFDIFPAATPSSGARLVRLTTAQLKRGSFFRAELFGLGSGRIILNQYQAEATSANLAKDNHVKVYDLDLSDSIPLGGFFLANGDFKLLDVQGQGAQLLAFGGPGSLSYFGRAVLANVTYLGGSDGPPHADGNFHWYGPTPTGPVEQYGDILRRLIREAQDVDRPQQPLADLTYDFTSTDDSAATPWEGFTGEYTLPVGLNYLAALQKFIDLGITPQMSGDLLLQAYQGFYGTDRTSTIFAANKIRFVNVDGAVGANIVENLPRRFEPGLQLSQVLVKGDSQLPADAVIRTAAAYNVVREGFLEVPGTHAVEALQDAGDKALQLRADGADVPVFRHLPGNDAAAGLYTPFLPIGGVPCRNLAAGDLTPIAVTNGDAENAAGSEWSGGGYLTSMRHGGVRSYGVTGVSSIDVIYTFPPAQVFTAGVRYVIDIWRRQTYDHDSTTLSFGVAAGDEAFETYPGLPGNDPPNLFLEYETGADGGTWNKARVCWTPSADRTGVRFRFQATAFGSGNIAVDDLTLYTAPPFDESGSAPYTYWLGDLVTLHTGIKVGDYNEAALRVYAINWQMDEQGNWWPRPELGGIISDRRQGGSVSLAGISGSGGGVVSAAPAAPPATVRKELTNKSGATVDLGDVVAIDPDNDEAFETTVVAGETRQIGIAMGTIGNNAKGPVATHGYVELVNVTAAVTRGHYGFTSATAKKASGAAARAPGAFVQFLKGGTTPSAILFGPPDAPLEILTGAIEVVIDGGGSAITTGVKGDIEIPYALTLTGWTLLADASGAIKVDIWKDTYANFPPTDADSITNALEPEIVASGVKAQDLAITDWSGEACAAGDILRFNVDSVTTIGRVTLSLQFTRT